MNAANQRQLTPLLVVIVVVLGALLLLLLGGIGRGTTWDAPRALAPLPPAGNPANLPQPRPLQQFALVWEKPLFSPSRKPIAHAVDGGSSLGDLELTGIILTPGLHMALLHDKNGDKQVRLREGESLSDGSVKLVEVRPRSALFDASGGRTELKLPAGAPIDAPKADANADKASPASGTGMTRVDANAADRNGSGNAAIIAPQPTPTIKLQPPPTANHAMESAATRLRENIQKRRAARAAAAKEGVR